VEKPLAPDAGTTRSLVELASGAGLLLVPVHQFLFQPGVRRLVEHGRELGGLVRCAFVAASAGAEKTGMDPDELVSEILPHPLSLFARLVPGSVGELDWVVARPAPGELRAVAVADHASLEIVVTSRGRPTRTELEVTGTEATALADLFHGFSLVDRGRATRARKVARPFTRGSRTVAAAAANLAVRTARRESAYPGLRELVRETYAAVRVGGPSPIPSAEVLAVADARDRILERLADSSRLLPSGRPVALGGESAVP
jgi:predicted dehydrogenase